MDDGIKSEEEVVQYHCSDFDALEWFEEALTQYSGRLPLAGKDEELETVREKESIYWETFFTTHNGGGFFKPRRYLSQEFKSFFPSSKVIKLSETHDKSGLNVIEAGCGHGCTMFPLLEEFPSLVYFATDYSPTAIQILESHPKYSSVSNRVKPFIWDIVEPAPCELVRNIRAQFHSTAVWSVLSVFTLSAIHPRYHVSCLCNIAQIMRATIDESSTT
eukprot:gene2592-3514_t